MKKIAIISASVRQGRNSHRVALYLKLYIEEQKLATVKIVDLKDYNFPIFEERLSHIEAPGLVLLSFAETIATADGVIIVTPEYNGGYPASLKNVIDLLYTQWKRKPVAIATVSTGAFAGSQVITSLQFTLWKIGALTVPAIFQTPMVTDAFDANGQPTEKEATHKRANVFVNELLWWIEAKQKMES